MNKWLKVHHLDMDKDKATALLDLLDLLVSLEICNISVKVRKGVFGWEVLELEAESNED
jgi:hypothetical protein